MLDGAEGLQGATERVLSATDKVQLMTLWLQSATEQVQWVDEGLLGVTGEVRMGGGRSQPDVIQMQQAKP